ncbi:HAMP domain-containing sensor histidine kinase [Flavobacterium enshiense]|uniref:sensor histidine kinase n=1 Tax=Flavobacterium enshiense TaxID=1341165 RepID=UPI00345D8471
MQLSFRNRIALHYIISTALLVFVVFLGIYTAVCYIVFKDVTNDIEKEIRLHQSEMKFVGKSIVWINKEEWEEKEHNEVNVNPVFVEIKDLEGRTIEKSPNLKKDELDFQKDLNTKSYKDARLNNQEIKLSQTPIYNKTDKVGYLLIAMSTEHPIALLKSLKTILFILYPIVLVLLFLIARLIAGRSIKPVNGIIETSGLITKDNLRYRITLPKNRDEIYTLSVTINSLLDRIENAVEREKQFTSDASHELRTPLSIIKGTLEVLIRKPREIQEYEEKINYCILEVDRLNNLVDELLLLARIENQKDNPKIIMVSINALIFDTLTRYSEKINTRQINLTTDFKEDIYLETDPDKLSIIISNLISNALKYCDEKGNVHLKISKLAERIEFSISNTGTGIPKDEIDKVFNPFFRSHSTNASVIKGVGLGLSIVKKLCDLLNITIQIQSSENEQTTVKLFFNT